MLPPKKKTLPDPKKIVSKPSTTISKRNTTNSIKTEKEIEKPIIVKEDVQKLEGKIRSLKLMNKELENTTKNLMIENEDLRDVLEKAIKDKEYVNNVDSRRWGVLNFSLIRMKRKIKSLNNVIINFNMFKNEQINSNLEAINVLNEFLHDLEVEKENIKTKITKIIDKFTHFNKRLEEIDGKIKYQHMQNLCCSFSNSNSELKQTDKNLLFLEANLSKLFHNLLDFDNSQKNKLENIDLINNTINISLENGINIFSNNEEKKIDLQEKMQKIFKKELYQTINHNFQIFKNELSNDQNNIRSRFMDYIQKVNSFLSENDKDSINIFEKYRENDNWIAKSISNFFEKNPKMLKNQNLIDFLKEIKPHVDMDLIFLSKKNNIQKCLIENLEGSIMHLVNFIDCELKNIRTLIKTEIFEPFNEVQLIFGKKEFVDLNSYLVQLSNIYELNQGKIENALNAIINKEDGLKKFEENVVAVSVIFEKFNELKKKLIIF